MLFNLSNFILFKTILPKLITDADKKILTDLVKKYQ